MPKATQEESLAAGLSSVNASAQQLRFDVDDTRSVSGLLQSPEGAKACLVLAHGAGAGMVHPSMERVASGLSKRGVATLRYQFPFMEAKSRRPDPPAIAHATVRAAVREAARLVPHLPLFAGGRSFGGRMTSQAQAALPLPGVRALVLLAFPLHPAGRPSSERGHHLAEVRLPMLFLQGTRDGLADIDLLKAIVDRLDGALLQLFNEADHAFHVPARSGRTDVEVLSQLLDMIVAWINRYT